MVEIGPSCKCIFHLKKTIQIASGRIVLIIVVQRLKKLWRFIIDKIHLQDAFQLKSIEATCNIYLCWLCSEWIQRKLFTSPFRTTAQSGIHEPLGPRNPTKSIGKQQYTSQISSSWIQKTLFKKTTNPQVHFKN